MPVIHGPQRLRTSNSDHKWDTFDPDESGSGLKTMLFVLPVLPEGVQSPLVLFPSAGSIRRISAIVGVPGARVIFKIETASLDMITWSELASLELDKDAKSLVHIVDNVDIAIDSCFRIVTVGATDARNVTISVDIEVI